MKHILCIISIILVFCLVFLAGCGKSNYNTASDYNDGVIGENKLSDSDSSKGRDKTEAVYEDAMEAVDSGFYDYEGSQYTPSAGLLTAGEWKDTDHLDKWLEKVKEDDWQQELKSRGLYSNNVYPVHLTYENNNVYNAYVKLTDMENNLLYTAKTDVDGMAYLFCPDDDISSLKIVAGDTIRLITDKEIGIVSELDYNTVSTELKQLDLMLMIDTTGSMSDELEYIKAELTDVVKRVAKDTALSIRISVNFYRDEGDAYVVKYFDFRDDVSECVQQISEQNAYGGGDFPEAVHTALDNIVNGHEWNEEAVKICFIVLDAPPHTADDVQDVNVSLLKSIQKAAELGIRLIPIASSGVDLQTEIDCRSFAVMTGGTYIFLTNDSGIGNDHLEASVGEYDVEPLNDCMVRVINEYCGVEAADEPESAMEQQQETTTENPNYKNP